MNKYNNNTLGGNVSLNGRDTISAQLAVFIDQLFDFVEELLRLLLCFKY